MRTSLRLHNWWFFACNLIAIFSILVLGYVPEPTLYTFLVNAAVNLALRGWVYSASRRTPVDGPGHHHHL